MTGRWSEVVARTAIMQGSLSSDGRALATGGNWNYRGQWPLQHARAYGREGSAPDYAVWRSFGCLHYRRAGRPESCVSGAARAWAYAAAVGAEFSGEHSWIQATGRRADRFGVGGGFVEGRAQA